MRYVKVRIARDTQTVYNRSVPEWEVPILAFIFEEGNVELLDETEEVKRDYPEAGFEFDRLTRCYGADPKSGVPHVSSVYGQARAGVRALSKAIEQAKELEKAEKPKAAQTKRTRGRIVTQDALLS